MKGTRGKLIALTTILVVSALACKSLYSVISDEGYCEAAGGTWLPPERESGLKGECMKPSSENTSPADTNPESEPSPGNTTPEEANPETEAETLIEACAADPNQYSWEFANVNYENSNETKKVCQGDLILRNTSNEKLDYKLYEVWDNNAMQDIGWQQPGRLDPGGEQTLPVESQTWSDHETVATFTKLIVFSAAPECADLFRDEKYEALWDKIAVPLISPCQ